MKLQEAFPNPDHGCFPKFPEAFVVSPLPTFMALLALLKSDD